MYKANGNIVPRDIGGIYFLVDITDKYYYDRKRIVSVNQTAFLLFSLMQELGTFSMQEISGKFRALFRVESEQMQRQIDSDVASCIATMQEYRYIQRVEA